jgi:hypothetical protein
MNGLFRFLGLMFFIELSMGSCCAEEKIIVHDDGKVTTIKLERNKDGTYKSWEEPRHYQSKQDYQQNRPLEPGEQAALLAAQLLVKFFESEAGQKLLQDMGANVKSSVAYAEASYERGKVAAVALNAKRKTYQEKAAVVAAQLSDSASKNAKKATEMMRGWRDTLNR